MLPKKIMIKSQEAVSIIIASIVFTFAAVFGKIFRGGLTLNYFLIVLLVCFSILIINIFTKKIVARVYDTSIEHKILGWRRYGIYERSYFPVSLPAGVILPFILSVISIGYFQVFTFLQFEVTPLLSKVKKAVGLYRFSDVTEDEIGWIAAWGIIITLLASVIAYIIGGETMILFAKLSIYYAFWNIIPLGNLDGTKIFFSGVITWIVLAIICLIALGYAVLLV